MKENLGTAACIAEFNLICVISKKILVSERHVDAIECRKTFQKGKMEHIWATQCEQKHFDLTVGLSRMNEL